MNRYHIQTMTFIRDYCMYYIDYYISSFWNLLKIWMVLSLVLLLLFIPPILWTVHSFLFTLIRGATVQQAILESRFSHCPIQYSTYVQKP